MPHVPPWQTTPFLTSTSENGFNLVDHSTIINEFRDHFPQLSRWVETYYGAAFNLTFRDAVLKSMRGIQQGDHLWAAPVCAPAPAHSQGAVGGGGALPECLVPGDWTLCSTRAA